MRQAERIDTIKRWLDSGRCLTQDHLAEHFGVSHATIKRDIHVLRADKHAPVHHDAERGGWRLDAKARHGHKPYAIALSLREDEVHALLAMHQLLSHLDSGGLLGPHIAPLRQRLTQMLEKGLQAPADVARRIRVLTQGARRMDLPSFQTLASALLGRRQLRMRYHGRSTGQQVERDVSPQRLVHYRDNWYLDGWCHLRDDLRSFSVDMVRDVHILDTPAITIPDHRLDEALGGGYGIFAGRPVHKARLRFSPERARWVAAERWHPNQHGRFDAQGHWLLDVPYADPRELVMDILRHVPDVEVLWPEELVEEVRRRLVEGVRKMGEGAG